MWIGIASDLAYRSVTVEAIKFGRINGNGHLYPYPEQVGSEASDWAHNHLLVGGGRGAGRTHAQLMELLCRVSCNSGSNILVQCRDLSTLFTLAKQLVDMARAQSLVVDNIEDVTVNFHQPRERIYTMGDPEPTFFRRGRHGTELTITFRDGSIIRVNSNVDS